MYDKQFKYSFHLPTTPSFIHSDSRRTFLNISILELGRIVKCSLFTSNTTDPRALIDVIGQNREILSEWKLDIIVNTRHFLVDFN